MNIYAQEGIDNELLKEQHEVVTSSQNTAYYSATYDERLILNMPFYGKNSSKTNAQGWLRSAEYYYTELLKQCPQCMSPANLQRIANKQFKLIEADSTYISCFPEYADCLGDVLRHHHIGEDGQCIALPESIHRGVNGIHDAEQLSGVTPIAEKHSEIAQLALDSGFITSGNDVHSLLDNTGKTKMDYFAELKTPAELFSEFTEWKISVIIYLYEADEKHPTLIYFFDLPILWLIAFDFLGASQ